MTVAGEIAELPLSLWAETQEGRAVLVNHSENHTFRVDSPMGRFSLRLHRPGYQSGPSIESELAWMAALHRQTGLPIPRPIHGTDGKLLQDIGGRYAVLFEHVTGTEPQSADDLEPLFETLGGFAARMHLHAEQWTPPAGFTRQVWSAGHILDPDGLWGDWRTAPGVDSRLHPVLDRLDNELRRRLAAYGSGEGRFGLIHADMRLGNVLVDGERVNLIDFDDCGFCWFAYDFAAAVSFHETLPIVPALKAAWLRGYLPLRPLDEADIAIMDVMVLLRRMALLAWTGSHAETKLAQTHMDGFAEGTAELAGRLLAIR